MCNSGRAEKTRVMPYQVVRKVW